MIATLAERSSSKYLPCRLGGIAWEGVGLHGKGWGCMGRGGVAWDGVAAGHAGGEAAGRRAEGAEG